MIYVIVENVPVRQQGDYYMGQNIVASLGYWTEDRKADAQEMADGLNQDACDDSLYGVVPLKPAVN